MVAFQGGGTVLVGEDSLKNLVYHRTIIVGYRTLQVQAIHRTIIAGYRTLKVQAIHLLAGRSRQLCE
jgi:hypothetical protein